MATSTFSPSNSSLHTWLTWDVATIPVLPKCQINSVDVNCTQVCNNSEALFTSQSNNLVTCGLWTTLVTEHSQPGPYSDPNKTVDWTNNTVAEYIDEFFPGTGLNLGDFQNATINASMYADTISNCLEDMYNNVKDWSFSDNGFTPAACTRQELFPIGPGNSSLKDCLQAICSPLTLNPDLAGIGVFSSIIAQSGIALIALAALLSFELWSHGRKSTEKGSEESHANRLVIALVEFHKAQCYFSSVIQITALALFHNSKKGRTADNNSETSYTAGTYQDFFDTTVLIVIASSGLIPVSLILACITRYGRQSWYLLMLSWVAITLASTTLISSYYWTHHDAKDQGDYDNNLAYPWKTHNAYDSDNSCDLRDHTLGDIVIPLCGNSNLVDNELSSGIIANWWTWLVWANCIIWMFFCLGKKCYESDRFFSFRERAKAFSRERFLVRFIAKEGKAHRTWILFSIIPWSLCFTSQFYLFSAYFQHRVISYEWTFGQIIAVFVWVPPLVEYIYIEINGIQKASNYKYPSPLMVVRRVASSSMSLINLGSLEVRNDEDSIWSPEIGRDGNSATAPQSRYPLLGHSSYS